MSIKPGTSGSVTLNPAIGTTTSETMNPFSPVEAGRTVSGGVASEPPWAAKSNLGGGGGGGSTPLALALSSTDFTNNSAMPDAVGADVDDPANVTNPALAWSLTGDAATVATYVLSCVDSDAADYVHWNVSDIAATTVAIAATTDPASNNWAGSPTLGVTGGGGGATISNGWEPVNPGSGNTHNYVFTVKGYDGDGSLVVTSNTLTGTYTGD